MNPIDTTRAYGNGDSEDKIGRVMKPRRDECYLRCRSTKLEYEAMKGDMDESLRTLGVDYSDLREPHDVSRASMYEQLMSENGTIKALHEPKEGGKIRFIGVTGHNWGLMRKLLESDRSDAGLVTCNVANRKPQVIPLPKQMDLGLLVMKLFGNSRLSGLSPLDQDRKPTVEECLRFALPHDIFPMIVTGVRAPDKIEHNIEIANPYEPVSEAEQKQIRAFGDCLGRG